jgi:hypothetical protein
MTLNKKMLNLIDINNLEFKSKDLKYWENLELGISGELIFPKITKYKEAYYLDKLAFRKNLLENNLSYSDLTESEWENNEIFLIDNSHNYKILVWKSIKIMKSIKVVLQESFAGAKFRIVSVLHNPNTNPSVSIRFYAIRDNEPEIIDINKLDKYEDLIMALEL